ncbi:MAG: tyrosine--tRNA ligase [Candidatus Pacebacteria bacterium]|nr:tyrosine--tRNA ligase [Candidatus Paceibacterota bacterium]MBP9840532.1 tyrosine--tRNA ligase [Candidatus Paceibacterota bacterium]
MNLAEDLKIRGLAEHTSASLGEILSEPRTVYLGMDPTADSLHVGHLVPILLMRRLGAAGHKLIFLVGGGTGMIGDPRDSGERTLLDERTLAANTRALKRQLKAILGRLSFRMVDNNDWLSRVKLIPFLRDIGKHFTVNELTKRDLIKRRLEDPNDSISYTEFTYALLQGYDYLHLHEKYGTDLQVGGTDQWTNMLSGVELIRRKKGQEAFVITAPIITDANGKKFGKSEGNAIWLDAKKTSPFKFYQFWINLPDDNLERYFHAYTFLPVEEIESILIRHRAAPHAREAQEALARVVTELIHGPAAVAHAAAATDALFGDRPFSELSRDERAVVLAEAPSVTISAKEAAVGYPLVDALVLGGLATSKSDARRLIEGRGISLNDMQMREADQRIHQGDLPGGFGVVRKGKRDVLVLVLK